MITLLYFASLREAVGMGNELFALPTTPTVQAVIDALRARGGTWAEALATGRRWRVAVNQEMVGLDATLKIGDEVAIFPPVTGG